VVVVSQVPLHLAVMTLVNSEQTRACQTQWWGEPTQARKGSPGILGLWPSPQNTK
jgi:hypothetical protein